MQFRSQIKIPDNIALNSTINPFLRNISAVVEQSNMQSFAQHRVIKNRYVKLKKNVQKINNFVFNPISKYNFNLFDNLSGRKTEAEEITNNFIKGERQRLTSKLDNNPQTVKQILFYIKKDSSVFKKTAQQAVHSAQDHRYTIQKQSVKEKVVIIAKRPQDERKSEELLSMNAKNKDYKIKTIAHNQTNKVKFRSNSYKKTQFNTIKQKNTNSSKISQKTEEKQINRLNRPIISHDPKALEHIKSESYILLEFPSNQVLLSYRSRISLEIASLTKIMTCYLVIKLAEQFKVQIENEKLQIRAFVEQITGTSAELIHGDVFTIQQLLYGLMLPSGNDAAICLADWGGKLLTGSDNRVQNVKVFVQQMNKHAKLLDLKDSKYGNPHGLPHSEAKSSAFDVSRLIAVCLDIPLFFRIINTKQYRIFIKNTDNVQREVYWENTNKLLRRKNFIGVKTGITVTAGPCLASAYKFRDKIFISVVLRSNKVSRRFTQTRKIIYWTLKKLYKPNLNYDQSKTLEELNKNNRQEDSDNSEEQRQFVYNNVGVDEFIRRKKILKYEL